MPSCPKSDLLWPWVRYFLELYLPRHRKVSPHTLTSYRTAFRQFRSFWLQTQGREPKDLRLSMLDAPKLLEFLAWLEKPKNCGGRGVSPQTRNCRLAALLSFFRFLELYRPTEEINLWQRLVKLPFKRTLKPATEHLQLHEVDKVFESAQPDTSSGFRDLTLLALLYNTGARASEVAHVCQGGLVLDRLPTVRFVGKGNRERISPLWPSTASLLRQYLEHHRRAPMPQAEHFVFINQRRGRLTRFGIGRIVEKHFRRAAELVPSLKPKLKRLSTHSLRHTAAIHLLHSGADVHVVKAFLGHVSVVTTAHYLDIDLEKYRNLLECIPVPASLRTYVPSDGVNLKDYSSDESTSAIDDWLDQL